MSAINSSINSGLLQGIQARFTTKPENYSQSKLPLGEISYCFECRDISQAEKLIGENDPKYMDDNVLAYAAANATVGSSENFTKIFELMKILIKKDVNINGAIHSNSTALYMFSGKAGLVNGESIALYNRGICLVLLHGGTALRNPLQDPYNDEVEKVIPRYINQMARAVAQLFEEQKTLILLLLDTTENSILTHIPRDIRKSVLLPEVLKMKSLLPSNDKGSIF